MTVLAETPADGKNVTSLITTIPPCYCSQAVDYGNIFDVYTTWQRNTAVADNKPHTEGSATSIVAGSTPRPHENKTSRLMTPRRWRRSRRWR